MKSNKVENLVWIIFASIGVIFILMGSILCINIFNYDNKIDTIGTITNISSSRNDAGEENYEVYVSYDVNGEEYESKLNGYSSTFYEGKEIEIYYDKDNPQKIGEKSLDSLFLLFPVMGLIFATIGAIGILVKVKGKTIENRLKENGEVIYADYIETVINQVYSVNGEHPYNIICEWNNPMDNKKYIFKSKNIWLNPESIILERNIKQFPVYLDKKNKNKYVIDIDELTENVVDLR